MAELHQSFADLTIVMHDLAWTVWVVNVDYHNARCVLSQGRRGGEPSRPSSINLNSSSLSSNEDSMGDQYYFNGVEYDPTEHDGMYHWRATYGRGATAWEHEEPYNTGDMGKELIQQCHIMNFNVNLIDPQAENDMINMSMVTPMNHNGMWIILIHIQNENTFFPWNKKVWRGTQLVLWSRKFIWHYGSSREGKDEVN